MLHAMYPDVSHMHTLPCALYRAVESANPSIWLIAQRSALIQGAAIQKPILEVAIDQLIIIAAINSLTLHHVPSTI